MLIHDRSRKKLTPAEREKKRAAKEARIKREWEAARPKTSPLYEGMAMGLAVGGRSPYAGMAQALAGVTDLTDEGHRPIDLTNLPPTLDCGTYGETEAKSETAAAAVTDQNVPASNAATNPNVNPKGGSDVAHDAVQTHNAEQ